jgi:hypothetical protein
LPKTAARASKHLKALFLINAAPLVDISTSKRNVEALAAQLAAFFYSTSSLTKVKKL